MAINLLDMLSNAVTPDILQGLARSVGESDSSVRSGISSLLPTVLGGLANKATTPSGASSVFSMLTGSSVDSGLLGSMGNLLAGGQTGSMMQLGTSLLSGLFGSDKVSGLGQALSTVSGMKASSAGSIASLVMPLAFAALKRFIGDQKLDATGLASLLGGQRDHLAGKLDPRMTAALGLGAPASLLAGLGSSLTGAAGAATAAVSHGAAAAGAAVSHGAATAAATTAAATGGIGRWLPWVIGAAVLAFLLPQLTQCGKTEKVAAPAAPAVVAPAPAPAPAASVAAAPAVAPAPVVAPTAAVWPAKVYFETGKAVTGDEGQATIKAVAAAMAADTAVKVAVTGFTDKSGNADANSKLAKDRAVGVRDALKAAGVAEDRIAMKPPVFVEVGKEIKDAESRRVDINLDK